jgi:hypothetical protein
LVSEVEGSYRSWIRKHTEFGRSGTPVVGCRPSGGPLLRSPALEEAERWIGSRPTGAPSSRNEDIGRRHHINRRFLLATPIKRRRRDQ